MLNRSLPPGQPVQHLLDKRGLPFYKGADGIWKAPDSAYLKGGKTRHAVRVIQPSRFYNFRANEYIVFPNTLGILDYIQQTGIFDIQFTLRPIDVANDAATVTVLSNYDTGASDVAGFNIRFGNSYPNFESTLYVVIYDGITAVQTKSLPTSIVDVNEFYHCRVVGDGLEYKFFVDGVDYTDYDNNTIITVPNASNSNVLIASFNLSTTITICDLAQIKVGDDLYVCCDEGAGIVAYDASGNGHYGDIVLNGTAEDAFHQSSQGGEVPSIQNTFGYNRSAYFNGVNWGNIQQKLTQKFEVNLVFRHGYQSGAYYVAIFAQRMATNANGVSINFNEKEIIRLWVSLRSTTEASDTLFLDVTPYEKNDITVKYDGSTFSAKNNLTGQELIWTGVVDWDNTAQNPTLGYDTYEAGRIIKDTDFFVCRAWELDASGNRIKELINLDFLNGNESKIKNVAADAPENSDAIWEPTDNGAYVNIPRSMSNPDQDVLGGVLQPSQKGSVRFEGDVLQSSVGNFDGNIYGIIGAELGNTIALIGDFHIIIEAVLKDADNPNDGFFEFGTLDGSPSLFGINIASHILRFRWNSVVNVMTFDTTGYDGYIKIEVVRNGDNFELIINGNVEATYTQATDINISGLFTYIGVYYNALYAFKGSLLSITGIFNGYEYINLKFSETNGLVWYNSAKDRPANSDADIILNGSADGAQWALSDRQTPFNLIYGFTDSSGVKIPSSPVNNFTKRPFFYDETAYATMGDKPELQLQNFEIELRFWEEKLGTNYGDVFNLQSSGPNKGLAIYRNINSFAMWFMGNTYLNIGSFLDKQINSIRMKYYGGRFYVDVNGGHREISKAYSNQWATNGTMIGGTVYGTAISKRDKVKIYHLAYYELDSSGNRVQKLIEISDADKDNVYNSAGTGDFAWEPAGAGQVVSFPDTASRHKDVLGNDLANLTPGTVDNNAESKIFPNPNFAPELIELGIDETFEI